MEGEFPYWVGNEGLISSVGISARELEVEGSNGGLTDTEWRRFRQMMAQRFSPQFAFRRDDRSPMFDPDSEKLKSLIGKVRDRMDYGFLSE